MTYTISIYYSKVLSVVYGKKFESEETDFNA